MGGCKLCSGDPDTVVPIEHGGWWECTTTYDEKTCTPKCPTPKVIKGGLECQREDNGSFNVVTANPDDYKKDKKLTRTVAREGGVTCFWPECELEDFAGLLAAEIEKKGWNVDFGVEDFHFLDKGVNFIAPLFCPNGKKSRTKCNCRVKNGKRKFKCLNLEIYKGC